MGRVDSTSDAVSASVVSTSTSSSSSSIDDSLMALNAVFEERWSALSSVLDDVASDPYVARLVASSAPYRSGARDLFELVFVPRVFLRQVVLCVVLELGGVTVRQLVSALRRVLVSNLSSRGRLIRRLSDEQSRADTQDEWTELAERIDAVNGHDAWRSEPTCELYESERLSARIDEFVHLMRRGDVFDLMFTLRGGIGRNSFGLLHEGLFRRAAAGSKVLVETYHNVVCAALDYVCDEDGRRAHGDDGDVEPIPTDARLAFFNETRHSYGRTALMLSGGAALGFYHVGVVKALMANGLLPRVLSGASAGSIVCAMIGTRTNEECVHDLFEVRGTKAPGHYGVLSIDFFRPVGYANEKRRREQRQQHHQGDFAEVRNNTAGGFHDAKKTWQLLAPIGLRAFTSKIYDVFTGHTRPKDVLMSDTQHFRECCKINIGNFTFQEAFDRTGRILNITVSPQNRSDPPRLLNYLTAPHVLVWSAAVASSSLPGVFEPNRLIVKNSDGSERVESANSQKFLDGSMEADMPMRQLSEMFNINHFIISQCNPHAAMFSSLGLDTDDTPDPWSNPLSKAYAGILSFLKDQVKAWITHAVAFVAGRRAAPLWDTRRNLVSQLFTQEYEGRRGVDVTLNPWSEHRSLLSAFAHCIYNPAEHEFAAWIRAAERRTWRLVPEIRSHIAEEITLDRCVSRLRRRLVRESWENKRRATARRASASRPRSRPPQQRQPAGASSDGGGDATTTTDKMNDRVPSFFTSPSLVNMSGLGVGDPSLSLNQNLHLLPAQTTLSTTTTTPPSPRPLDTINLGWNGMGLQGNRSYASLPRSNSQSSTNRYLKYRSNSYSSGLFVDDDASSTTANANHAAAAPPTGVGVTYQVELNDAGVGADDEEDDDVDEDFDGGAANEERDGGYLKTSNMAMFYYRRSKSHENFSRGDVSRVPPAGPATTGAVRATSADAATESQRKWSSSLDLSQHGKQKLMDE